MYLYRFWRGRWLRAVLLLLILCFVGLNGVTALVAHGATHFAPQISAQERQPSPPLPQQAWRLVSGVRLPRPENRATPADHNLPYEVRMLPVGAGGRLEAWYVPHQASRGLVIMFSGYAGVKEALLTPAAHLYRFGYSSLLVDFRGSGGSSGDDTTVGIREAEDVVAAFTYATEQLPAQPLLGYGVSMGGAALMRAVAIYQLKPRALILEGVFDRFVTTVRHRFEAFGVPSFPAADLLVFWGAVGLGVDPWAHNPVDYAAAIRCPTLLMHGERDPWVTAAETRSIADAIPTAPTVLTVPDKGHEMPFVYGAPDLWSAQVQRFLDQQSGT